MRDVQGRLREQVQQDLTKRMGMGRLTPLAATSDPTLGAALSPVSGGSKSLFFVNHSAFVDLLSPASPERPHERSCLFSYSPPPSGGDEALCSHEEGGVRGGAEDRSRLFRLPIELHSVIAPFLSFQDRLQLSLTCKGASDPRGCAYRAFERLRIGRAVCKAGMGTDKISLLACPPLCKRPVSATRTVRLPLSSALCLGSTDPGSPSSATRCTFALDAQPEALFRLLLRQTRQLTTLCVNEFVLLSQHLHYALRHGALPGLERLEFWTSDGAAGIDARVAMGAATCLAQALAEDGRGLQRLSHLDCCDAALESGAAKLLAEALEENAWPNLTHLSLCVSHDDGRERGERREREREQQEEAEAGASESPVQRLLTALTRRSCALTVPLKALRLMADETEKEGEEGADEDEDDGGDEDGYSSCRAECDPHLRGLLFDSDCCAALEALHLDDVISFRGASDLRVLVDYLSSPRARQLASLSIMRDARHPICADQLAAALGARAVPGLRSLTLSCDFFLTQTGADSLASWLRHGVEKSRFERLDLAWLSWEPREAASRVLEGLEDTRATQQGKPASAEAWSSLKVLCVTEAGGAGVEVVSRLVAEGRLPAIEELVLGGAPVGDEALLALVRAATVRPMTALRELDLWQTELSVAGMQALCVALQAGAFPVLEDLEVGDNAGLGEDGVRALIQAMVSGALTRLRSVRMRHVDMGKGGVRALAEALERGHLRAACPRLRALAVNEGKERLKQAIRGTDMQLEE